MSINEAQFDAYGDLSDERLCQLTQEGNRDAEEALFKRYHRLVQIGRAHV